MPSTRASPARSRTASSSSGASSGQGITQDSRFIAIDTPLGKDKLGLVSFTGQETVSRLFQFETELVSPDHNLNFDALIGQPVTLRLNTGRGGKRCFHGHVSRFVQLASGHRFGRYQATIVPWLWFLTRAADCRIYQKKTIPQIIEDVFKRNQFPDFEWRIKGQYTPWEYCVQYRETDFNFVSRLLEQEGIYYFFKHDQKRHVLVLCDDPTGHEPAKGYEEITYRPGAEGSTAAEYIFDWSLAREVQTTTFEHTDYDPLAPTKPLKANYNLRRRHDHANLAFFDYPGEYDQPGDGKTWAKVRLQEVQARFETAEGRGDVRGLAAGYTFTFKEYPRKDQCRTHLLLSVRHSANAGQFESETAGTLGQPAYHCSFRVMDATVNYRPPRTTAKPIVQGPQTAVVVGPKGDEIHVDDHARVKVQFFWDRYGKSDENSSCWMRVSQPWAGKGYGGHEHSAHWLRSHCGISRRRPRPAHHQRTHLQRRHHAPCLQLRARRQAGQRRPERDQAGRHGDQFQEQQHPGRWWCQRDHHE
jgi:type VI secretion system secreted protein VgrG